MRPFTRLAVCEPGYAQCSMPMSRLMRFVHPDVRKRILFEIAIDIVSVDPRLHGVRILTVIQGNQCRILHSL
ncbi:hypothetical protein BLX05_31400, partial [Bacillus pseudomycoides]